MIEPIIKKWNPLNNYSINQLVVFGCYVYKATSPNTGILPYSGKYGSLFTIYTLNSGQWQLM